MKNLTIYILIFLIIAGCKKIDNYPGGKISDYISIYDVRGIYKGTDVKLTTENMFGSNYLAATVISDHRGKNLPEGLLIVQDNRRSPQVRGIAIALGADAATYIPGDSLHIKIDGGTLTRLNGILQITGLNAASIEKKGHRESVPQPLVNISQIRANPANYENTLLTIVDARFTPKPAEGDKLSGNKMINDRSGNIGLTTNASTNYADSLLPYRANYTGIVLGSDTSKLELRTRTYKDIFVLSATAPEISPVIITGFLADPVSTDANYEYIQLMATRDINFAIEPYSLVTNNNAGANLPQGVPLSGWATGNQRTYKFNLNNGTVRKGEYFYVGGNKVIWGQGSTDISSSKWIVSRQYASIAGDDFGAVSTNLLANSGNVAGMAVFKTTTVTATSRPVDVIFYGGTGGAIFSSSPLAGYLITNTDYYSVKNLITLADQPYFNMGSNTLRFGFPTAVNFAKLKGIYNTNNGWAEKRTLINMPLTATSTVAEIEGAIQLTETDD